MKLSIDFKFSLNKEQHEQLLEMARWVFEGCTVTSTYYESYTIFKEGEKYGTQSYCNYMTLLLFQIPMKLGMDVVVIDPENPDLMLEQIYEKYRIYNNIPETSKKKSKYRSTASCEGFYKEDYYGFCGC